MKIRLNGKDVAKWASRKGGYVVRVKAVDSDNPFKANDANCHFLAVTLLAVCTRIKNI